MSCRGLLDAGAVGPREQEQAVVRRSQPEAAFVNQPVMEATERDQVRELRLAAERPVQDVMPLMNIVRPHPG